VTARCSATRASVLSRPSRSTRARCLPARARVRRRAPGTGAAAGRTRAAARGWRRRGPTGTACRPRRTAARRHAAEQRRQLAHRRARLRMQREVQLAGEARGAEHAYRILAVARLRVADQPQHAALHVRGAADVVPHREVRDVVVERVRGEVAAPDVVVDRAVDVVAEDPPALVVRARVVDFAVVLVVDLRRRRGRAERGDLDDLVAEVHVREPEAAPDQSAVAEQRRTSSGRASVAMSKSFGRMPSRRSRTLPPTRNDW
jgi:hypothetical protein